MEVNLSLNHHRALTLTTSRTPSLSALRTHFLGSTHTLRPPPPTPLSLRSRNRNKRNNNNNNNNNSNLGLLRFQSPRFVFKASFHSHSVIVVVIVVTLSAVSWLHFTLNKKKNKTTLNHQRRGHAKFALSSQGFNVGNRIIDREILGYTEFQREKNTLTEIGKLKDHHGEDFRVFEDNEIHIPFLKSSVVQEVALAATETSESPSSSVLDSGANNNNNKDNNGSKVLDEAFLSVPFSPSSLQPLEFAEEMAIQVEESQDKVDSDDELPLNMVESEHTASSVSVNNALTTVDEHTKEKIELGAIDNDILFGESVREGLYMFYEVNKPATRSMTPLSSLKSLSPRASFMNKKGLASVMGNGALKGSGLSTDIPLQSAEHVKGAVKISSHNKEGYPPQHVSKNLRKGGISLREMERNSMDHNSKNFLPLNAHSINVHVDQTNGQFRVHDGPKMDPSELLSKYNNLLKVERLHECVELLKDMETKGLLDMTKVYHAKFFNICKKRKAVKEAFDFIRLIPNPMLSTFNMLMSVCASSQDSEGAFQVLQLLKDARLEPDCKLYTTLILTCAKSGKVDLMFEVFHKMVNSGVEPNVHTYGALIDGCARAGQVAKAFGAYGIMRSKNVKPDRVVFNALIAACAQSGALDRAFDVLAEMTAETQPIDPDHVTIGALLKACTKAGQVERAKEVYKMVQKYNIKGCPEVYTIAINSCSQTGDWEFAHTVYNDMTQKGILPDEIFLSALIDVAGHAKKLDAAFDVLQEARKGGILIGIMSYSSLMGACSNARNWQKALELYEYLKSLKLTITVSTVNALLTALCDGDQFQKALEVLFEMKGLGLRPNSITFSILIVASEKKDDMEAAQMLLSLAKKDGVVPNLIMCRCIIGMCQRRFEKACFVGEPVLSFDSGRPQVDNKWTSLALMVYRETIEAGEKPTSEILSQILGCLQLPYDTSVKNRLVENLGVSMETSRSSNLCSLMDGFGEYDPRAFSILEESASHGVVPSVSLKVSPVVIDAKELNASTAEVYLITVLKGLKHRLAAGARLPNIIILLPVEKTEVVSPKWKKNINLGGRAGQAVGALLRRLQIPHQGSESNGKLRIGGLALKKWFQPKLAYPFSVNMGSPTFSGKPGDWNSSLSRLGKSISNQQRNIRTGNLSLD
ncbi:pentatricopeptide repeat-containing protein MRL1, chloroplastic-like isoform X2 [Glycine soja]|uniref:Pentatricopeptide repeat-containing protein MRL1, chloroplastic n=1 Tax=Glycine soja TaxID=3848 RepID=A0A445J4F4_GLYSO|nr:pentatricopeptide repeat-containing protein MRL1, chloroplastic-like isoform X2 [Glycine soja]KHN11783.1 Pentatricopeptide repeat-containing protein, chloroplastic [Glycine soja]RZB93270.1 Pentatricopeptide repeat-containing protein MRL1, chloroplastic [Glycine soja]